MLILCDRQQQRNYRLSIIPGSNIVTALRGFRVRLSTLDKFLVSSGKVHGALNGFAPLYHFEKPEGPDEIRALLRARAGGGSGISYVVPAAEGHDETPYVYVAYQYHHAYSQLRIIPQDPPEQPVPAGFEQLKQEVLGYRASSGDGASQGVDEEDGAMGLYIVYTEGRSAPFPAELKERYKEPIQCDQCDETFLRWSARQWHLNKVHGIDEPLDILPGNA